MSYFTESSRWISAPQILVSRHSKQAGTLFFRKKYLLESGSPLPVVIRFCGLGIGELYFNGEKISAGFLDPAPSVYDKHAYFREYQVTLQPGENVFGVILGNGMYNLIADDFWQFHSAPWRDFPKMIFDMRNASNDEVLLVSDSSWRMTTDTPVFFNSWHGGEFYDARKEIPGWLETDFDDSSWQQAAVKPGPGGELIPEIAPAAQIVNSFAVVDTIAPLVYDLGRIITGWVKITVRGEAGSQITLKYSDHLSPENEFTQVDLGQFIPGTEVQTDRYILRGSRGKESWHPRFVYHAFQYVQIAVSGNAEIVAVEAMEVHTGFEKISRISCGHDIMQKLYHASLASYSGNFVGIPTDCPHREKNGWTADAAFAAESGLFSFDAAASYRRYVQAIADCQRDSGQLPGIVPSGGWGYNYGSGPVWDAAFWMIPELLYIHTGDAEVFIRHYEGIKKHFAFLGTLAEDNIIRFGLGDHNSPFPDRAVPEEFVCTAFYALEADALSRFAAYCNKIADQEEFSRRGKEIRASLLKHHPARPEPSAWAIYAALGIETEENIRKIAGFFRDNGGKAEFGIVGAGIIPRLLAEAGHVDLAFHILTQQEYPGFGNWIIRGATTLWEYWDGAFSRNHIMFGDIISWLMRYPAGIRPDWENPGLQKLHLKPLFPAQLQNFSAQYRHKSGMLTLSWQKKDDGIALEIDSPAVGCVEYDSTVFVLQCGINHIFIPVTKA